MENQSFIPFWLHNNITSAKKNINIILLAHVQEPRGHINQKQLQCSETERFSIEEFNDIYQGIVNAGYYIQAVYYNELDFITDYTEHPKKFQNCLIYNLARNGLGDNKKTIIPAFCELVGLNYTSSSSLSCALCRNKYYFTTLLHKHNIPVPKTWMFTNKGTWLGDAPVDGTQVICKPRSESASQGVNETGIFSFASNEFKHIKGTQCIVQEYINGPECEVPVFKVGDTVKALSPVGIDLKGSKILDEQASAANQYGFYHLGDTQTLTSINTIQIYAEKAFQLMQMDVYGRVDFRISPNGVPYIFDISTTPYTTKHSSFAFAFERLGLTYSDIYQAVITAALQRSQK